MIDSAPPAPAPAPSPAPSAPLAARIRDTFFAPRRLFGGLGADPPWIGALGVATAVAAVALAAEPAQFYLDQMEDPVNRRGAPVELTSPPEQIVLWGRVMAVLGALVGHPIIAFALAGVLTLVFRLIRGGEGTFRQYLSVASHTLVIMSVGLLVANVMRAVSGNPALLPTAGGLIGMGEASTLGRILNGVNLFTLWMLVAVAAGVAAIERRVTLARASALLLGAYLILVVTGGVLFRA